MEIKISNARLGFWVEFLDRNRSAWRLTEKGATKLARYWMAKEQDAGNSRIASGGGREAADQWYVFPGMISVDRIININGQGVGEIAENIQQ